MSEPLRFPFRSPDDPLEQVGDLTREAIADPTERAVVREVALHLAADGAQTTGDAIAMLEQLGSAGRRRLVDEARVGLGMPDLETEAAHQRWEIANRGLRPGRDSAGKRITQCAHPDCRAMPTNEFGMPQATAAKRWWCSQHAHLAAAGDFDPPSDGYVIGPFGRAIPIGEERARVEAEETRRLEEEAERTREREAIAAATERARERWEREHMDEGADIMGFKPSQVRKA